jgi:hypothetical protein
MKHKLAIAFGILVLLVGFNINIKPGQFRALAQAGVCQFAAYGPGGSLINTTITCVTPAPSGSGVTAVTATATACGAAVAVTTPFPSPLVQVPVCPTASPGPSLPLSIINGGTGTAAPAPTSSNGCTITGTWPSQTFSCPTAGSGGAFVTLRAAPTASPPDVGYAALTGGIVIGPSPMPTGFDVPSAFQLSASNGSCGGQSLWGTNSAQSINGISGPAMMIKCGGTNLFAINQNGAIGTAAGYAANGNITIPSGSSYEFLQTSTTSNPCAFFGAGSGVINFGPLSGGTCTLVMTANTLNKGQVSCSLSTLVCTATATVPSGAVCTASYDTAATTVTAALLLPLTVKVVTTTLSVGMQGAATATGTAAADYLCL